MQARAGGSHAPDSLLWLLDVPDRRRREAEDARHGLVARFERVVVLTHDEGVRVRLLRVVRLVEDDELDVAQVVVGVAEDVEPDLGREDDDIGLVELLLPLVALPVVDALCPDEALDPEARLRLDDLGLLGHEGRGGREEDDEPLAVVAAVVGGQRCGGELAQSEDGDEGLAGPGVGSDEAAEGRKVQRRAAREAGLQEGEGAHTLLLRACSVTASWKSRGTRAAMLWCTAHSVGWVEPCRSGRRLERRGACRLDDGAQGAGEDPPGS